VCGPSPPPRNASKTDASQHSRRTPERKGKKPPSPQKGSGADGRAASCRVQPRGQLCNKRSIRCARGGDARGGDMCSACTSTPPHTLHTHTHTAAAAGRGGRGRGGGGGGDPTCNILPQSKGSFRHGGGDGEGGRGACGSKHCGYLRISWEPASQPASPPPPSHPTLRTTAESGSSGTCGCHCDCCAHACISATRAGCPRAGCGLRLASSAPSAQRTLRARRTLHTAPPFAEMTPVPCLLDGMRRVATGAKGRAPSSVGGRRAKGRPSAS